MPVTLDQASENRAGTVEDSGAGSRTVGPPPVDHNFFIPAAWIAGNHFGDYCAPAAARRKAGATPQLAVFHLKLPALRHLRFQFNDTGLQTLFSAESAASPRSDPAQRSGNTVTEGAADRDNRRGSGGSHPPPGGRQGKNGKKNHRQYSRRCTEFTAEIIQGRYYVLCRIYSGANGRNRAAAVRIPLRRLRR